MAFYIAELKKLRQECMQAYEAGELKKALYLIGRMLSLYQQNDDCDTLEYAADLHNIAVIFDDLQHYEKAAGHYEKAAALKKKLTGESLTYCDSINNLAICQSMLAEHEKASENHAKVLEIRQNKLGKLHEDSIRSLYHLGNVYFDQKQYRKALEYLTEAQLYAQKQPQLPLEETADICRCLAETYQRLGQFDKAIRSYEKAVSVQESLPKHDPYCLIQDLIALSVLYEKAHLYEKAVERLEQAVEEKRSLILRPHLDLVSAFNSLAAICYKAQQYRKSFELHTQALDMVVSILGRETIFYAEALHNLAFDYHALGDETKALELHLEAAVIKKGIVGENHAQYALSLMSLGTQYDYMQQYEQALAAYRQALVIRSTLKERDASEADSMVAMAQVYAHQQAYEKAADTLRAAMFFRRSMGDSGSAALVFNLQFLAEMKLKSGDAAKAFSYVEEACKLAEKRFGKEHPYYAAACVKSSEVYSEAGEFLLAQKAMEEAVRVEKKTLFEENPLYRKHFLALAEICVQSGETEKAIRCYLAVNDMNFEETPEEKRQAAGVLLAIANCYLRLGNRVKAEGYFAEAENKMARCQLPLDTVYTNRRREYFYLQKGELPPETPTAQKKEWRDKTIQKRLSDFTKLQETYGLADDKTVRCALELARLMEKSGKKDHADHWYALAEKQAEGEMYPYACRKRAEFLLQNGLVQEATQKLIHSKRWSEEYGDMRAEEYRSTIGTLADAYFKAKDMAEALRFYKAWDQLFTEEQETPSQERKNRLERMVKLYTEQNHLEEALECCQKVTQIVLLTDGEGESYWKAKLKEASLLVELRKKAEAEKRLDLLLKESTLLYDINSQSFGRACDRLGRLYFANRSFAKAEAVLKEAYRIGTSGAKCLTKAGLLALLAILKAEGKEGEYQAVKSGEKLQ